ncbi:MAG: hypothetical protein ACOH2B_09380 [Burkholderiaceae bacterium]
MALALAVLGVCVAPMIWAEALATSNATEFSVPIAVDKSGKIVGRVSTSATGSYGSVIIDVNHESIVLGLYYDLDRSGVLASNGLSWQSSGPLIYGSSDCSGRAYVGFGNIGSSRPVAVLQRENKWLAYIGQAGAPQQITAHSYLKADGICIAVNEERKAVPVASTLRLETVGVPPFYIR